MSKPIAEIKISCGRTYLAVRGVALILGSSRCFDVHMSEIAEENDYSRDDDGTPVLVWTDRLMEKAAERINGSSWKDIGATGTE